MAAFTTDIAPGGRQATITLDVGHPGLDHHRPGGRPLLGTVLGLGALASVARGLTTGRRIAAVTSIGVHEPWIHSEGRSLRLDARVERRDQAQDLVHASLFSGAETDAQALHLRADFRLVTGEPATLMPLSQPLAPPMPGISAGEIYRVFFHGPAFQVVAQAGRRSEAMVSRLAVNVHTAAIPPMARLLEFALQTAGLLELSASGRMMIPHAIAAVEHAAPADEGADPEIVGRALFDADGASISIEVATARGLRLMTVRGYRTVALPFASDTTAAATLGQRLAASAV